MCGCGRGRGEGGGSASHSSHIRSRPHPSLRLVDVLVPSKELYGEAFLLARTTHRSACDMFYVALARREDAILLTNH